MHSELGFRCFRCSAGRMPDPRTSSALGETCLLVAVGATKEKAISATKEMTGRWTRQGCVICLGAALPQCLVSHQCRQHNKGKAPLRDCHSAAPPSPFSRCSTRDTEGDVIKMTVPPTATRAGRSSSPTRAAPPFPAAAAKASSSVSGPASASTAASASASTAASASRSAHRPAAAARCARAPFPLARLLLLLHPPLPLAGVSIAMERARQQNAVNGWLHLRRRPVLVPRSLAVGESSVIVLHLPFPFSRCFNLGWRGDVG